MYRGFVCLWRYNLDERVFQNANLWKVYSWCLMKASHTEQWITLKTGRGETEVQVKPGQFIFGRKKAARELKMKPSSVRNWMQKLKNMRNLDTQSGQHYTLVTVLEWNKYQFCEKKEDTPKGQAKDNQRTTKGQPKDTYNNGNNGNNYKQQAGAKSSDKIPRAKREEPLDEIKVKEYAHRLCAKLNINGNGIKRVEDLYRWYPGAAIQEGINAIQAVHMRGGIVQHPLRYLESCVKFSFPEAVTA